MPLGTVAVDMLDFVRRQVDRVLPPASRQNAYDKTKEFATTRPMLFSFIVAQITFSTFPVLCFLAFVLSVLFAFSAVFIFTSLFWVGIALFILVPILVLTSSVALITWGFGAAGFTVGHWSYTILQGTAINSNQEFGDPQREEGIAASSSSLTGASRTRVEDQAVKQKAVSERQKKEPTHPDPGSDLEALEP